MSQGVRKNGHGMGQDGDEMVMGTEQKRLLYCICNRSKKKSF